MINLLKSTEICYFYRNVNLIRKFVISIGHDMISQIFIGKSHPANTLSCPADTIRDLYNRAIVIPERDFYHQIRDFLCDSINGRDIAYP